MPTKREAIRIERRRRQARRKTIQIIAIGIVALAAIAVIALIVSSSTRSNTGTGSAATLAAYEKANSATPILVGTKQYNNAPPITIDQTKQYFATVKMAKGGEFVIQLYPDKAPITVNSFVFLAQHRILRRQHLPPGVGGFYGSGRRPNRHGHRAGRAINSPTSKMICNSIRPAWLPWQMPDPIPTAASSSSCLGHMLCRRAVTRSSGRSPAAWTWSTA